MKSIKPLIGGVAILLAASVAMPVIAQEEKKAESKPEAKGEAKGEAKAKAEKVAGDIGLLDTEKNYMIVVTKEGKLVTLDFNAKTKAMERVETKTKMSDVGLGSSATVEYVTKGEKNFLSKMTFVPAKGE